MRKEPCQTFSFKKQCYEYDYPQEEAEGEMGLIMVCD
jgi:hypothetical protein